MVLLRVGCKVGGGTDDGVSRVSRVQSFVEVLRVPCRIGTSLCVIVAVVLSKVALQPWSQSWPIERRLPDARVRKRWTS